MSKQFRHGLREVANSCQIWGGIPAAGSRSGRLSEMTLGQPTPITHTFYRGLPIGSQLNQSLNDGQTGQIQPQTASMQHHGMPLKSTTIHHSQEGGKVSIEILKPKKKMLKEMLYGDTTSNSDISENAMIFKSTSYDRIHERSTCRYNVLYNKRSL